MSAPSRQPQILYQWADELGQRLPMTKPQVMGLALWSIGTVLARSGSLTAVSLALSVWLPWSQSNLIKRLREWYLEAAAKKGMGTGGRGKGRRDWKVEQTAPALGRWILDGWPSSCVVLALDATSIHDRFTVLAISLLYRRSATPLLWTVLPGNAPEAWQPHWERMLTQLAEWIGGDRFVLVLSDRGLYSPRLFHAIVSTGWHPLMRIRDQGYYQPTGQSEWTPLANLRPPLNEQQTWTGDAFKNAAGRLSCTLVAWWTEGHAEPWLLLTDLAPERIQGPWYGLRGWIEQSFKCLKSAGWDCEQTRMTSAERVERHWLALSVAMLWTVSAGGQAEADEEAKKGEGATGPEEDAWLEGLAGAASEPTASGATSWDRGSEDASPRPKTLPPRAETHLTSVFRRGWMILSQALAAGRMIGISWHPEPLIKHVVAQAGFS
jgi:Transposase DDE domain